MGALKGLWLVPTHTIDPGWGITIYDLLIAFFVTALTLATLIRTSKKWPEARLLLLGLVLLSLWFILHWIDMIIQKKEASVNYSYIFFDSINRIFRATSDVCILWGMWRVLIRYKHLRPSFKENEPIRVTTIIGIILWGLAVYHVCLLFAVCFAWLYFADLDVINSLMISRNAFEIAFTAALFIGSLGTAFWAGEAMTALSTEPYEEERLCMFSAAILVLLRSFCEVVIVGQLDRDPAHLQAVYRARDATYGLFSLAFMMFIIVALPKKVLMTLFWSRKSKLCKR